MTPAERATQCQIARVLDGLAVEAHVYGWERAGALEALAQLLRFGPETGCVVCGSPLPSPARTGRPRKRCDQHSRHGRKLSANPIV